MQFEFLCNEIGKIYSLPICSKYELLKNIKKFSLYFSKISLSLSTTAFSHAFIANQPISGLAIIHNHFL